MLFTKDSKSIIGSLDDKSVRKWTPGAKEQETKLLRHGTFLSGLAIDKATKMLMACSWDHELIFWDLEKNQRSKKVDIDDMVSCMSFHESTNTLVCGTYGGGLHVWDTKQLQPARVLNKKSFISGVVISPDGAHLLVAYGNPFSPGEKFKKLTILKLENGEK